MTIWKPRLAVIGSNEIFVESIGEKADRAHSSVGAMGSGDVSGQLIPSLPGHATSSRVTGKIGDVLDVALFIRSIDVSEQTFVLSDARKHSARD